MFAGLVSKALKGQQLPSLAIFLTTFLWGTWWIPLRKLDGLGNGTVWLTGAGVLLSALVFLPHFLRTRGRVLKAGWPMLLCALFFGLTTTLYAEGALRGNVARVILLFYLTPVWSTLLARLMLGEPITRIRLLSICIGLLGMWVILGGGGNSMLPLPRDMAEWMGLLAGVSWALAMVYVQKNRGQPVADMAFPIFFCFAASFVLLTLIPGGRSWGAAVVIDWSAAIFWIIAIGLLWHVPTFVLTLFGATKVEPGRVAILLMMEVVIGVGSAAWFANEPFGIREVIGTLLVIAASICEFLPNLTGQGTREARPLT